MLCRAAALLLVAPAPALALGADVCDPVAAYTSPTPAPSTTQIPARWPRPLDRVISVQGGVLSLRDALDRVAAAARVRLTYSDALLSLERRVCLDVREQALGDAITQLIGNAAVEPRAASAELVVLAPRERKAASEQPLVTRAAPLERVIVTGTATGGAQRNLSVSVGVVDGASLEVQSLRSLSSSLNGSVAGIWLWQQSPAAVLARYGSIRGASSFGVSYPKVYIDGVEVANPLVVAQAPGESIERMEVLRGPQGAALYGTDAISGVMHLVTRQPTRASDAPNLRVRAQAGHIASAFAESGTFGQDVVLSAQGGDISRAAAGTFSFSRVGAFVPDAESRHISASGRGRVIARNAVIDATARLALSDVASSSNPLLLTAIGDAIAFPDSGRPLIDRRQRRLRDSAAARLQLDRSSRQSMQQFTGGVTGTLHPNSRWTHRGTVGVDAYALDGAPASVTPLPTSSDSALRAAEGSAMRVSARASSAATWSDSMWQRTLTVAAEHAVLREATSNAVLARPRELMLTESQSADVWRQTTGGVLQLDIALQNALYLTAGTRVERSAGFTSQPIVTVLPMLGAAYVMDHGNATIKLRGAYGKGIRPPRTTVGGASLARDRLIPNDELDPESQSGIEYGVDFLLGRRAALHITRFDQTASGLVQPVTIVQPRTPSPTPRPGDLFERNLAFQLQNVGAIDNSGWEFESSLRTGPFSLRGSLSLVDSRVRDIRRGYTGELRIGDRMLDVPARTLGVSAEWRHGAWRASVNASRASDWIGYDRIAASQAFVTPGQTATQFVGASLRDFWITYPGVTRVGAMLSRELPYGASLQVAGDNLLDRQVGEPDNITILPGRTISVGLRLDFQR